MQDVETRRRQIADLHRRKPIRFDCAVIYDEEADAYCEIFDPDLVVDQLATADELISQNGKRWDLLVLEQLCGRDRVAPLWSIPHVDLMDISGFQKLDVLAAKFLVDELPALKRAYDDRVGKADIDYPRYRRGSAENFQSYENMVAGSLATARFDVERTYLIYQKLEALRKSSES